MSSNKKRISVYVSPRKHTELKTICSRRGISMSMFIDKLIQKEADREGAYGWKATFNNENLNNAL